MTHTTHAWLGGLSIWANIRAQHPGPGLHLAYIRPIPDREKPGVRGRNPASEPRVGTPRRNPA